MSIRISCPSCEAILNIDDDKAGKKVRCRKCEEVLTVPAAGGAKKKREEEAAIQEKRKVRVKARARDDEDEDDDDDEDDDRSIKKKSKKAKGGAPVMLLALGGVGLLVLLAGGILAVVLLLPKKAGDNVAAADAPGKKNKMIDFGALKKGDAKADDVVPVAKVAKENPKAVDPFAGKPLPDAMTAETRDRVKGASIYIRVHLPDGQGASGSGFLAGEPGLIVTNAHVVGMLARNAQPPKLVECILNSGQDSKEVKMVAKIIGVDRFSDLAFLRVENTNLPAPLLIDSERKLAELQVIYTFGFPLGEGLGKEITIGEGKVSSIRKDKVQLNANLQPGNSGGPVVNSAGNVIGVAVSIIKGTALNFAVPAQNLVQAMEGHVSDTRLGQAYTDGNQLKLPVKLVCIDPLKKIGELKVEVWTGSPGPVRDASMQQPQPKSGDGTRQTHKIDYQNGIGTGDVLLPAPSPGQVCWVQSVVTNARGTYWGPAVATPTELYAIERRSANLTINLDTKVRTVKFKSSEGGVSIKNDVEKFLGARKLDLEILEELVPTTPPSDKMRVRTNYGIVTMHEEAAGRAREDVRKSVIDLFRQMPPGFSIDRTNKLVQKALIRLNAKANPKDRDDVIGLQQQLYSSIEVVNIPMPNKTMQPLETWVVKVPYMRPLILPGMKFEPSNLVLTCTFQGVRTRDSRSEAVITVSGSGQTGKGSYTGTEANGRIGFDTNSGYISFAQVRVTDNLFGFAAQDGSEVALTLDVDVDRKTGNLANIPTPKEPPPPIVAKGKKWFDNDVDLLGPPTQLLIQSPNPMFKQAPAIVQPIKMQAGKTYVITLDSDQFDAYLMVKDFSGKILAEDDDGGATPEKPFNARIEFRCQQTAVYQIVLTSFDAKTGKCHFKVQEDK
jgi:predicted Zn finger-like uncharacterized protein